MSSVCSSLIRICVLYNNIVMNIMAMMEDNHNITTSVLFAKTLADKDKK